MMRAHTNTSLNAPVPIMARSDLVVEAEPRSAIPHPLARRAEKQPRICTWISAASGMPRDDPDSVSGYRLPVGQCGRPRILGNISENTLEMRRPGFPRMLLPRVKLRDGASLALQYSPPQKPKRTAACKPQFHT